MLMRKHFVRNIFLLSILLLISIICIIDFSISYSTKNQIYTDVKDIPKNKVGIILGTAKYQDKAKQIVNEYYQNRINAAVALYMAGKIDYIIVSGDNSTRYYNEPLCMKEDLIAQGIPPNIIYMDDAGFRTLDSILRCRDIFNQHQFTIISQNFHNQRAVFISNHKNINVVAFDAADGNDYVLINIREKFARIRMVGDLIFNTKAKFYGDKIVIN